MKHPLRTMLYHAGLFATGHSAIKKYTQEIEHLDTLSKKEIEEYQLNKINSLLLHAQNTTSYYAALFKKCKLQLPLKSLAELNKIPILTKEIIQKNQEELTSSLVAKNQLIKNQTGGSTGKPLHFYQDKSYFDYGVALQNDLYRKIGISTGDCTAYLWGSDKDYSIRKIREKINETISNRIFLNTFNATEEQMLAFARKLQKRKPLLIVAYATSLYAFAQTLQKHRITTIHPKAIQSSAETLQPQYRKLIEKVLHTKVFNSYGSREVGNMAHECSAHDGLHESFMMNYLEIVDGKIIVTNLRNYAMPFIRYEIGDISDGFIAKKCKCGNNSRRIINVKGRITDIIKSPSGKKIHGEYFTHVFYPIKNVTQFQVVQETLAELHFKILGNLSKSEKAIIEKNIQSKIHAELDPKFICIFSYPEKIQSEASGKFRFTISKLK